jgi:hypothetical protein
MDEEARHDAHEEREQDLSEGRLLVVACDLQILDEQRSQLLTEERHVECFDREIYGGSGATWLSWMWATGGWRLQRGEEQPNV